MAFEDLYFAYGSNLSHEQMAQRCPHSVPYVPARLIGYKLVFAGFSETRGGPVADVRPDNEWYVQGGLYRMTPPDIELLDGFEGHPDFYLREKASVLIPSGEKVEAWLYRMTGKRKIGKPTLAYLEIIIRGFFDFEIVPPPEVSAAEYIE